MPYEKEEGFMTNELQENRSDLRGQRSWTSRRKIAVGSVLGGLMLAGSAFGITAVATAASTPHATAAVSQAPVNTPAIGSAIGATGSTMFAGKVTAAEANCVRAHGVPAFPNPDSQGVVNTSTSTLGVSQDKLFSAFSTCVGATVGAPAHLAIPNPVTASGN
jgi:hypothetical protein